MTKLLIFADEIALLLRVCMILVVI